MKYNFLHISDLHYRPDWNEENELVCQRLVDDLETQVKKFENLHLIFSGDIVFAGGQKDLYINFDENFSKKLTKLGISTERRICIPGNHDLSRDALKPNVAIQRGSLQAITDERSFNDTLPQLSKHFLAGNLENYKSYEGTFAKYTCCQSDLGGTGWEIGEGIGVYCLNTALCSSAGLDDSNGKAISDKEQLMIDTRSLHNVGAYNEVVAGRALSYRARIIANTMIAPARNVF